MNAQMSACDYYFKPVILSIIEYSASFFPLKKQALYTLNSFILSFSQSKKILKSTYYTVATYLDNILFYA